MLCVDCSWYYQDEDESHSTCKFTPRCADDLPPCEQEELEQLRMAEDEDYGRGNYA